MVREIKTFEWKCDCCKTTKITHGESCPDGWETYRWEPSFQAAYSHDFCLDCICEAEQNHTANEDNYYGMIMRKKETILKYKMEQAIKKHLPVALRRHYEE